QLPTGEPGQPGPDDLGALGQTGPGLAEARVDGHGPGVDHRGERFARHLVQRQFVELLTAGYDTDEVEDAGQSLLLEGEAVDEGLRHRLDGEQVIAIAGGVLDAIEGGDADRELLRVGRGQIRNVVRVLPGSIGSET